ncbi:MAG: pentapeptide repeat-containing protein [Pseudodesulfovibrio sp.]|uniref:pentapeptide repeat-containing protein n=1 Tax=Pseudodesulfovibrio sp. TaxID=2035812 RepID=UPI003D1378E9
MSCCMCEKYHWDPQEVVYEAPEDGKEYCLFHAPAEHKYAAPNSNKMSIDEFNAQVAERIQEIVDLEDENACCNLRGAVFPGELSFSARTVPRIIFDSACFKGKVSFHGVVFQGGMSFEESIFENVVEFRLCGVDGEASFEGSRFAKTTVFAGMTFEKRVSFDDSVFSGNVNFQDIKCTKFLTLVSTIFSGTTQFKDVGLDGGALCISTKFNGPAYFTTREPPHHPIFFSDCVVSPSGVFFENCNPKHYNFVDQLDLSNIHFRNSPWGKKGRIKVYTEDQHDLLQPTRDFYQRMKAKYKAESNENEASKWHIAEKEAQLKLLSRPGESKFLRDTLRLYKWTSGFGENPRRAFWVLVGLLLFPLGLLIGAELWSHFAWWDFDLVKINHMFKNWLKFIPLTQAIPKDEPGISHAFMIAWQLLITLQAALFAFALRNNFRR